MQGECLKLQKKLKKDKIKRPKAILDTWNDEESDSTSESKDQVANLCLITHEDNSSEVNSKIDFITTEQWEELYENLYTKYKKFKYENKTLKIQLALQCNSEEQLKNVECIRAENESLKSKNESLINKIALLDLDLISLNDKLSSLFMK